MPTPDRPPLTRAVVLRGIGFAVAIALGAVAAWLVVTSDTQKSLRIGMLVGLWGLLLGAYSMFGARRGMGVEAGDDPGREIALRENRAVERSGDADARRDWEARLERLITREISTAVGRETAALRNEIAHLRQELVDKVGGQLRLERIETTRVIGSDLSALQDEVRQLKDASGSKSVRELLVGSNDPRVAVRPVVEPARVRPVSRPTAEVEADVRPAVRPAVPSQAAPAQAAPAAPAPAAAATPPQRNAANGNDPASAPISRAAAQAAQARNAGAAASQLGGQRRPEAAPPATSRPAGPVSPPSARERPADAAARVHTAPAAAPAKPPAKAVPSQAVPGQPSTPAALAQPAAAQAPQQPAQQARRQPPQQSQQPKQSKQTPPPAKQTPPAAKQTPPTAPPADSADPFAALPRLSRFTDFELDPVSNGNGNGHSNGHANGHRAANGTADSEPDETQEPSYSGRRRRGADEPAEPGRHASNGTPPAAQTGGGRRRRAEDADDGSELLARLLARETSER